MIEKPRVLKIQKKFNQKKGYLVSLEDYELNLEFKRVFWISGLEGITKDDERGNHGHENANELIIVLRGSCHFFIKNLEGNFDFIINSDDEVLYLPKNNILIMKEFSEDALLLVICDINFKDDKLIF